MERWIDVPGGRLFALSDGDGPPIVLVHSGIADHRSWDAMIPGLVRAGHRVVRFDCRWAGRSTTADVEFSSRADLIAVLDAFGIRRAVLVGNSIGGQIAFDTAIEHPDRFVAVVGVSAGISGFAGQATPEEQAAFDEIDRLDEMDPPDADAIADLDVRVWVDGLGQSPARLDPAIREAVRAMDREQYLEGRERGRPIRLRPPAAERLAELRMPVLAVAGALDMSDVAQTAEHLQDHAPDARAVIWPDTAHMIGMEVPDRLTELLVAFVRPLGTWD